MTTTTETIATPALPARRRVPRVRSVVAAFVVGAILATTAGAVSLAAYSQMHAGKILPGVHVGTVDVSGLDRAVAADQLAAQLSQTSAPAELRVSFEPTVLHPMITADATAEAQAAAARMTKPILLEAGDEQWTLPATTVRSWIDFGLVNGTYGPQVDAAAVKKAVAKLAARIDRSPVNAKFLFGKSNRVVGVTQSSNGRALDVAATT